MRRLKRASLLLFVLTFAGYACDLSSLDLTGQNAMATSLAATLSVIIAASQQSQPLTPAAATATPSVTASSAPSSTAPPSGTPVPTLSPTVTPTPPATATAVPIFTPTPIIPMITVSVPTNCRDGPGLPYDMTGALLPGEKAQVLAVDPTRMFWYIPNPDSPGDYCWVWGQYATIVGGTYMLPVFTPPPTPTPAPGFDFTFEGLVACPSAWWLQFKIKNTGQLSFQSIGMTIKDTSADKSASDTSDSFFDQSDCSTTSSRSALLPGKTLTVSPVALGYDPSGNKLKVSVTLCSEDDQDGTCVTQTITVKP